MREAGRGPEPPTVGGPLVGYLRIANGSFSDDTGVRCPVLCHAGDLIMRSTYDWDGAMQALDTIAAAGYHGIRSWDRLRWGGVPGAKPGIYGDWGHELVGMGTWVNQVDRFLRACRERGLRVHLAAGDLAKLQGGQRADYFNARAQLTFDHADLIILNEWANEARDTARGLGPDIAERDMAKLRALPNLVGLTAYTGHEDQSEFARWTPQWMAFCLVHALRDGRWWDKIRHIFSLPYEDKTRRLWWHGEPWGVGPLVSASTPSEKAELTRSVYGLAAWQTAITGGVWTDFYSAGVVLGDERFTDYPQFGIAPIMAARAEAFAREHGLALGQLRLMHGGAGRPNVLTISSGHEARIDQAIDDAKGVCLATVYGPEGIAAKSGGGYTWTWVNPETGELVENVDVTRTMNPGGLMGVRK